MICMFQLVVNGTSVTYLNLVHFDSIIATLCVYLSTRLQSRSLSSCYFWTNVFFYSHKKNNTLKYRIIPLINVTTTKVIKFNLRAMERTAGTVTRKNVVYLKTRQLYCPISNFQISRARGMTGVKLTPCAR